MKQLSRKEFLKMCPLAAFAVWNSPNWLHGNQETPAEPEKMIAYCGIACSECPAYVATQKNDDKLRESREVGRDVPLGYHGRRDQLRRLSHGFDEADQVLRPVRDPEMRPGKGREELRLLRRISLRKTVRFFPVRGFGDGKLEPQIGSGRSGFCPV
jgi:hypothetical protein